MNKQEKAQRLLHEVSAGLSALAQAVRWARATTTTRSDTGSLDQVSAHAQRLDQDLQALAHAWPVPSVPEAFPVSVPRTMGEPDPVASHREDHLRVPGAHALLDLPVEPIEPAVPSNDAGTVPPQAAIEDDADDALRIPVLEIAPVVQDPVSTHDDTPVHADPASAPLLQEPSPDRIAEPEPEPAPPSLGSTGEPLPAVTVPPLILHGDLAPFEPEHDRPIDQDVVLELPVHTVATPPAPVEPSLAAPTREPLDGESAAETQDDTAPQDAPHAVTGEPQEAHAPVVPAPVVPEPVVPEPVVPEPSPERPSLRVDAEPPGNAVVLALPWLDSATPQAMPPVDHADSLDDELEDDTDDEVVDQIEEDVMPIFFDEAPSLIEGITRCFQLVRQNKESFQKDGRDTEVVPELHRLLHTLKGNTGMVGAKRARKLIHVMESMMEDAEAGRLNVASVVDDLEQQFDQVILMIDALERRDFTYRLPKKRKPSQGGPTATVPAGIPALATVDTVTQRKSVRVNPDLLDRLVNEANEAKLTRSGLESTMTMLQGHARDLDENVQGLIKMLRELEIHAESQIQSRRSQIEETGEEFDPLEFDRFTRLQELARFLSERAHDTLDLQQGVSRAVAEQETLLAYQERSVNEIQESLTKTRLTPFDDSTGPLVKMTKQAAKEVDKEVDVRVDGGSTELDRALIEKITIPLQHALRNAVVHGIESRADRLAMGKPAKGQIVIAVRQEAGRVFITIQDDGGGIRVDKVRQKAIERGLWSPSTPMSDQEAADMVCTPHFSTVDAVSELAGRGVGMDVVRSDVLALGGRFDLKSSAGHGLSVALQLPTTLSTAATLIVEAQGERIAIPVECVEHVISMKRAQVLEARERGWVEVRLQDDQSHRVDFRYLPAIMGLKVTMLDPQAYNQVVVVRESDTVVAVLVDRLIGAQEVPIRPIGRALSRLPGIVGTTVLSDGHAAFVIDPARTRAAFVKQTAGKVSTGTDLDLPLHIVEAQETQELPGETTTSPTPGSHRGPPLVMVVDDSLTVRKASARFLQREGYAHVLAKDGQEAVEMLATVSPDLILLDVEMPRMDGFDFAKHVREHPRHHAVPIIMITSRIADKHRKRADAIGVNGYLGKPFKEEELLDLLHQYTGHQA